MFFSTKLALAFNLVALASALQIDSPASLIVCQPASLTFSGGSGAPYYIAVLPGGQPSAAALVNLPQAQSSPVTWTVNQPAGTNVSLKITDVSGTIAYSSSVIVQAGSSTSCLTATSGSTTTASGSTTDAASGSTTASGSATTKATTGSTSASASAAAATTSKSAGFVNTEAAGSLIAIFGLLAAALGVIA